MASTENKLNGNAIHADDAAVVGEKEKALLKNAPIKSENLVSSSSVAAEESGEITKRSIRVQTWKKIQDKKCHAHHRGTVFNRIPNFIGADAAADRFAETDEFVKAKSFKVDIDRSQDAVKLQVLAKTKDLYISTGRETEALYAKINCAADQDEDTKKKAILLKNLGEFGTEIEFLNKVELDVLVFGSVAVSRTGQRIGRGNGYVDLDFGILTHSGAVTPKTLIVSLVHDEQVYDTLPTELFTTYDVPVDMIVTPTQVIRVSKRLPRPTGIQWPLLSQRRLEIVPVLKPIKANEEKNGKVIVLKSEDTDVETNRKPRQFRRFVRKPRKGRNQQSAEVNGSGTEEKASPRPRKRFYRKNRKSKKSIGDSDHKNENRTDDENESGPQEVTKRSLRVKAWKKMSEKRATLFPHYIFNRIPNFVGADKAAALLAETDEFIKAKNVKVISDKAQDHVKLKVLGESKNLYVSPTKESNAVYSKINCPADAEAETKRNAIRTTNIKEFGTDIEYKDAVPLDLLVVSAVAVSKTGQRLGRGNGYVDLDFGILVKSGAVTDKTVVVATVHDEQVYDTLPEELFTDYDVPLDIIVTPTEVIRIEKRLSRPKGILWNLLSQRRLDIVPVLKVIKEAEEKDGKIIVLKDDDTDIDTERKEQGSRRRRRYNRSESKNVENSENKQTGRRRTQFQRRRRNKAPQHSDGEIDAERGGDGDQHQSSRQQQQKKYNRHFCIKVSNIPRSIRIKEFKSELRERGCNPVFISWKGSNGMCFLHFGKPQGDEEVAITGIINTLDQLSLIDTTPVADKIAADGSTPEATGAPPATPNKLKIEVVKRAPENRIEPLEVSAV